MKTAEDYWAEHSIISKYKGEGRLITEASFKHVIRLAQSESKEELDSLKKLYNDLAESHAKQVIEIKDLRENYEGMKSHCKYLTEINVFNSCFDNADKAWRDQHKVEDGEDFIHWYMRYHACERKDLEDDNKKLKSELLKAKERFCQCAEDIKTGSTSAMHCNHCGKIEQSETWLK